MNLGVSGINIYAPHAEYRWEITRDYVFEADVKQCEEQGRPLEKWMQNSVGVQGPANMDPILKFTETFRMFDDDGELCAEGLIGGEYTGFEPLWDYGKANWGCTTIRYKNDENEWEDI